MTSNLIALVAFVFAFAEVNAAEAEVAQGSPKPAAQTSPSGAKRFDMSGRAHDFTYASNSTALDGFIQKQVADSWLDLKPTLKSLEAPFETLPDPLLNAMRTQVRWRTNQRGVRNQQVPLTSFCCGSCHSVIDRPLMITAHAFTCAATTR